MTSTHVLEKGVMTVAQLLADPNLVIPTYQRPYKWTGKNIAQLFSDISANKDKSSYRLGTLVFHIDGSRKNIVDGQQRTVSLLLAAHALIAARQADLDRNDLREQMNRLAQTMINPDFSSDTSRANIHENYLEIYRIVSRPEFTEGMIDFLLNKCEVVFFCLNDISEAFQFFDSQNARGRDLEPHDLLKAFHLREFSAEDEHLKAEVVSRWERSDTEELSGLFSRHLFRIRNWSRGASARYFGKEDTYLFKGVNIDRVERYPFVEPLRMAHHFVDDYNRQYQRKVDGGVLGFPFHLDQTIINGRRFFEMISHYQDKVAEITSGSLPELDGIAPRIMLAINRYEGRHRTGDRYVRSIYDCLLICYYDKFGASDMSRALEKAFIWAYGLRLRMQVVQLASADNHVLENNLFMLIRESVRPADFLNCKLPELDSIRSTRTEEIERLFREMHYCE